jgi:hypothetical protein
MSLEIMLSRLKKVRRSSPDSFMACCPAHDDRNPSLSIKDSGGGRLLINCLAGCETLDVLGAIGMDWADVLPPRLDTEHHKPIKPTTQRVYATYALKAIQLESRIVVMCAFEISKGNKLSGEDMTRLRLAMERINTAAGMANG